MPAVLCTEWVSGGQYGSMTKKPKKSFFDRSYSRLYDARAMSGGLPANIDPVRLADKGVHLEGTFPLRRMKRLLAFCRSDEGLVSVDLVFGHDRERHIRTISGFVTARITTTCVLCLAEMMLDLQGSMELMVYTAGQEILGDQENILIASGSVSLDELVENELILAMPMMPAHQTNKCTAINMAAEHDSGHSTPVQGDGDKSLPFVALAKLKRSDRE